ncbi:MAG: right-handed parallel beta-helix repeat-containing protein, partial [Candidatus Eisenbacteria bacterium]
RSDSGNAADCIIDVQQSGRAFTFQSGEDATSVLEAFTITGGIAEYGGAIYCLAESGPRISGCVLVDNDRDFSATGHGVITAIEQSNPIITGCHFEDNHAHSGGTIYIDSASSPQIDGCTFVGNYGDAINVRYASVTITDCLFTQNFDTLIRLAYSSADVTGSTVAGGWFGAVSVSRSDATFTGCTLAFNGHSGSATISLSYATLVLQNTIIAHGGGAAVSCSESQANASCTDIFGNAQGDWTGCLAGQEGSNGNLSAEPHFCDPSSDDLTLAENSPCAPDANPGCGQIGAWPVGCGSSCVLELTPPALVTYYPCNGTIPIDLTVSDVIELGSFDVCVGFDDHLSFEDVVIDPGFLGSTGRTVTPTAPVPCTSDCQVNGISFGAETSGMEPGPSGEGRLGTIFFGTADRSDTVTESLCLDGFLFENTGMPPAPIPVSLVTPTVLTHRPFCYGDFNDNGDVSIADVMEVAGRWGSTTGHSPYSQYYDVNLVECGNYCISLPDGVIDVIDVQSVAAR